MQHSDTKKLPAGWFDPVFLGGIAFVGWCRINDPLYVCGILSALFLLWKWRKGAFQFSGTDGLILVLWVCQIVNLSFSVEPVSGFFAVKTLTFGLIFYFLLRISLNRVSKLETFLFVACILIFVLCAVASITFLLFHSACAYVGFTGLYDFRHLYKPLGYLTNVWGSLLIGFAGIVLLALHLGKPGKTKFVFLILLTSLLWWNLAVSFSRGVYLASLFLLLSYGILLVFSGIDRKRKVWIIIALVFPLLIAGFAYPQDIVGTLQFNRSLSQQRSIAGRMDAMSSSYELFKKSPLTGTGAGTYQQVINTYRYEDDDAGFTSFAPNGYTQLLVEQGLVGLILWGSVFALIFIKLVRKRKQSSAAIVAGIVLAAVLIREATFPVLLESVGFQMLIFSFMAVFQHEQPQKGVRKELKHKLYFPLIMLTSSLFILAYTLYYMREEQNNSQALQALKADRPEEAETYILKTSERTPYLINRYLIYHELYRKTNDTAYLNRAASYLQKAALKNPNDAMLTYYQASVLRASGKHETALSVLTELTQKFPNKSLYRLGAFDLLYQNGQRENAFPRLLQAVKSAPGILDSSYLKELFVKDSTLKQTFNGILLQNVSKEKNSGDPVLLAKTGKIFLWLGFEKEAKPCLEKAVRLLPNLIYPHYHLSQIESMQNNPEQSMIYRKQFVFLCTGTLSKTVIAQTVSEDGTEKLLAGNKGITDHSYTAKFQTWYHSSTNPKPCIP
ncbi:MAG: O-antigen ligase family protein [Tannerella sp.]|jgi:tetratricopeptide (TPR) repeat protein/O-antigen ligase|nr:O-antigen ligase family protein [Tannerella sp.]